MNETDGYSASRALRNSELETEFWNSIDETTNIYNDWKFFLVRLDEKLKRTSKNNIKI